MQPDEAIDTVTLRLLLGDIGQASFAAAKDVDAYRNRYVPAMLVRVPSTFQTNGIKIEKVETNNARRTNTRYEVRIEASQFSQSKTGSCWVQYDLTLFDFQKHTKIWGGRTQVNINTDQPLLRSEKLAGDILNSLYREGIIKLTPGYAVTPTGERITDVSIYSTDK
ncbi:hypothetical protein Herbaro_11265 [Herbaspirillum sp. WKF16]|uniref:hypothetical protein n=1 Tax=Herbaspirillum sp. WKF16 TaxID=3028312 RepID=UPI0023A9CAF0|nr:hypothetical protein [Herbaspirillum sp. WKF16]WDZ98338.1 hypothetical protein Herbaro_11265 [Herbaspirillum sp. WKF16]